MTFTLREAIEVICSSRSRRLSDDDVKALRIIRAAAAAVRDGDQVWWCETHKTFSIANELNPELVAVQCWWSKTFEPEPCQMQERLIVSYQLVSA